MSRDIKIPGPDHPITITPSSDHVVVRSNDATVADSRSTLLLREAQGPTGQLTPDLRHRQITARDQRADHLLPVQGRGVLLLAHC